MRACSEHCLLSIAIKTEPLRYRGDTTNALTVAGVDARGTRAVVSQDTPGVGVVYSPRTPGIASLSEDHLRPAPDIGQDSYEVLREAGLGREAIDDLVKSGVVRQAKGGVA